VVKFDHSWCCRVLYLQQKGYSMKHGKNCNVLPQMNVQAWGVWLYEYTYVTMCVLKPNLTTIVEV